MLWAESETSKFLTSIPDRDNSCGGRSCVTVRVITVRGACFFIFQKGCNILQLIVNGKEMVVSESLTIGKLVLEQGYNPAIIVIEYNQRIVNKEEWQAIVLQPNDCLEIVSFVGGG